MIGAGEISEDDVFYSWPFASDDCELPAATKVAVADVFLTH